MADPDAAPAASEPRDPHIAHTFAQLVQAIADGNLNAQLGEDVQKLVAELNEHAAEHGGKAKGELVLKLTFELDGGMIEVKPESKLTTPKPKHAKTVFWSTRKNLLTRTNPRQMEMFGDRPVRTV